MATKDIVKHLIKVTENDFASVVSAGIVGDCTTYVDTGSYSLNALLSGSLYGGVPSNKITCLAGSEAVGKTFFALSIAKNYLQKDKTNNDLLMKEILDFFSENNLKFDDISQVYVNQGPGNFSGLRGSIATAKGICISKNLRYR